MQLKKFKELIKDLPDDTELIMDARSNPFGTCWSVLTLEVTSQSFFGKLIPALKLSADYAGKKEGSFFIDPQYGKWFNKIAEEENKLNATNGTKKLKQVCLNVEDLEIGDRFICQVSTSPNEKDIIPGQTSGSRYYPRIISIKKTRWYIEFNTQYENYNYEEVPGLTNVISHKRQDKTFVLRKR